MKYAPFILAACLVVVQLEFLLVLDLQKKNLEMWDAQTEFNGSVVDVCTYVAGH